MLMASESQQFTFAPQQTVLHNSSDLSLHLCKICNAVNFLESFKFVYN